MDRTGRDQVERSVQRQMRNERRGVADATTAVELSRQADCGTCADTDAPDHRLETSRDCARSRLKRSSISRGAQPRGIGPKGSLQRFLIFHAVSWGPAFKGDARTYSPRGTRFARPARATSRKALNTLSAKSGLREPILPPGSMWKVVSRNS